MNCTFNTELLPDIAEIRNKPDSRCPVDWALNAADIARMSNCGKSVMCRDGMQQLYTIISDITSEKGQSEDIELLRDICEVAIRSEGCELASRSAELIYESINCYTDEWMGHIRRKRCSALECKSYYTVHVLPEKCDGCGECIPVCGARAIGGGEGLISVIDAGKCTRCGECLNACQRGAIVKAGAVKPKTPDAPIPIGCLTQGEESGNMKRRKRKLPE